MSNLVLTVDGLIELADLAVAFVPVFGDNYVKVAIEYRYKDKLVKRSVMVDALRPLETTAVPGEING